MCIDIFSPGHVTVPFLLEQMWLEVDGGRLLVKECYDAILRSHGAESLDHLYVLSPRSAVDSRGEKQDVFVLLEAQDTQRFNSAFERLETADNVQERYVIQPPDLPSEGPTTFRATALNAVARECDHISDVEVRAMLRQTGMTMARIEFAEGRRIEPYDPSRDEETTYWLRLAYSTQLDHYVKAPQRFGLPTPEASLAVLSCEIMGPGAILESLAERLRFLESHSEWQKDAKAARQAILGDTFGRQGTSARIEDHRISLVTDERFLVLNTHQLGDCRFVSVGPVKGQPGRTARTWVSGARRYPDSDALMLARSVYQYLRMWASHERDGKTKEQICSAVSPGNPKNVAHVLDALRELGFAECRETSLYSVERPDLPRDHFFLAEHVGSAEVDLGPEDKSIRTCLYGDVPATPSAQAVSRFKPRSYRIGFDLGIGSWSAAASVSLERSGKGSDGGQGGGEGSSPDRRPLDGKKVFIVHGRNHAIRDSISLFVANDLGLPISIMEAGANQGRTVPEKFEEMAGECAFAVFLLTADDDLAYSADSRQVKRARQNVILEIGYFWGALGRRNHAAFLVDPDPEMELPSDLQGIGLIPITRDLGETKLRLQKELHAAGLL